MNTPSVFLSLSLYTCCSFFLDFSFPRYSHDFLSPYSFPSFNSLCKCHFVNQTNSPSEFPPPFIVFSFLLFPPCFFYFLLAKVYSLIIVSVRIYERTPTLCLKSIYMFFHSSLLFFIYHFEDIISLSLVSLCFIIISL